MKKLDINQLDEKEEEIADALISVGLGRPVARTLAYLNNGDEATSDALENGTGLPQPEVSIAMRQLKESDWINDIDMLYYLPIIRQYIAIEIYIYGMV